jgi:hypothetical protein
MRCCTATSLRATRDMSIAAIATAECSESELVCRIKRVWSPQKLGGLVPAWHFAHWLQRAGGIVRRALRQWL